MKDPVSPLGQVLCSWCGLVPATTSIFKTAACVSCVAATPKVRTQRALLRWKERSTRA